MLIDTLGAALGPAFTASALPQWIFTRGTLRIVAVNDAAIDQYGLSRDKFLELTVPALHPEPEREDARLHASGTSDRTPLADSRIWRHATARGERLVRIALSDIDTDEGPARLAQVFDVTSETTLQEAYSQAVARCTAAEACAEAVNQSRDTLLAIVGHELRQPLMPVVAAIAVMEQRISQEVGTRAREIIKRQVGVLARIVDDMLDVARLQQGKIRLQPETQDLRRVVEEIVSAHFPEILTRALLFDTNLPSQSVWVSIDGARFHQILSNLLTNAIRHSEPGGRVSVRVEASDGVARLIVSDEGDGIDASVLPRVFEPFTQAAHGANGGLGIGLSVVRALVELHDGQVTAINNGAGCGAQFVVTLPTTVAPVIPVKTFASDLRSVAELIRVRAANEGNLLDGALDGIDTALLVADDHSRILNANRTAVGLTGYSERELETLHVPDILAMNASHIEEHWRAFIAIGRQEGILMLRRKDGARVPVRYCAIRNVRPGLHLSALGAL